MAEAKFRDEYEHICMDKNEFLAELHERQENTIVYEAEAKNIVFYAGAMVGENLELSRLEGDTVSKITHTMTEAEKKILCDDESLRIGLYACVMTTDGAKVYLPISQNCKLSLGNRSTLTFNGELSMDICKMALARLYEDLIPRATKKEKVQVIAVYGKAQAMMTNVYSAVSHESFFEKIDAQLKKRFGDNADLRSGYISHKWTRGTWGIGEYEAPDDHGGTQKIRLGVTAMDSQTGHSGAVLQPCIFSGKKNREMFFDDSWYSKHMAFSDDDIDKAIDTVYITLNDNAQRLLDTIKLELAHPSAYARHVCEELNKLAVKTKGVKISAKIIKNFVSSIQGLSCIRSNLTAWDVIELLWDIPAASPASEAHKDGLKKTVSRVLALDHATLDAA